MHTKYVVACLHVDMFAHKCLYYYYYYYYYYYVDKHKAGH